MATRPLFYPRCDNGNCARMNQMVTEIPKDWTCVTCGEGKCWQRDNLVMKCTICKCDWGTFNRRHHCRACGYTVCSSCLPHECAIPEWEDGGKKHRTCKLCAPDGKLLPRPVGGPKVEDDERP